MHSLFYIRYKKFYLKLNILGLKLDLSAYNLFIFIKSVLSFYNYKAFLKILQQEKKSFVVIELNSFHGEILTPWHHCLKELNSNNKILFLVSPEIYDENPFFDNTYDVVKIDRNWVLFLINHGFLSKYKKAIFNSDYVYERPFGGVEFLYKIIKKKYINNALFISHNINLATEYKGSTPIDKIIVLAEFIAKQTKTNYFFPKIGGKIITQQDKLSNFDKLKKIVVVGNMNHAAKDYEGLLAALKKIEKKDSTFSIDVVGKVSKKLPKDNFIKYHDRLSFVDLYDLLSESHYILFLLKKAEGYNFRSTNLTGSFLLSLNFKLIPVVEGSFLEFYSLNKDNAIVYDHDDIYASLISIIEQDKDSYIKMISSLEDLSLKLHQVSLNDVSRLL